MTVVQVFYMDRRGAGCIRHFTSEAELEGFVRKLRREAVIRIDDQEIGKVYRMYGEADDQRIKWGWYFERWEGEWA